MADIFVVSGVNCKVLVNEFAFTGWIIVYYIPLVGDGVAVDDEAVEGTDELAGLEAGAEGASRRPSKAPTAIATVW